MHTEEARAKARAYKVRLLRWRSMYETERKLGVRLYHNLHNRINANAAYDRDTNFYHVLVHQQGE